MNIYFAGSKYYEIRPVLVELLRLAFFGGEVGLVLR